MPKLLYDAYKARGLPMLAVPTRAMVIFVSQGINSSVSVAVALFLSRYVGVEAFGQFSFYLIIGISVSAVISSLIAQPLVSITSQKTDLFKILYSAAVQKVTDAALAACLLVSATCSIIGFIFSSDIAYYVPVFGVVFNMAIGDIARRNMIFRGREGRALCWDLVRSFMILALFVAAFKLNVRSPISYAGIYGASLFTANIGYSIDMRLSVVRYPTFRRALILNRSLAYSGRWLASMALVQFLSSRALIIITYFVLGGYSTGVIRVAQSIVGLLNPIIQGIENVLPQALGGMIRNYGMGDALRRFRLISHSVLLGLGIIAALTAFMSNALLEAFGITPDNTGKTILLGFLLSYIMTMAYNLLLIEARAVGKTRSPFVWSVAASILGAVVIYPLLLLQGPVGLIIVLIIARAIPFAGLQRSRS